MTTSRCLLVSTPLDSASVFPFCSRGQSQSKRNDKSRWELRASRMYESLLNRKNLNDSIFTIYPLTEPSLLVPHTLQIMGPFTADCTSYTHLLSNCLRYHSPQLASPFLLLKLHLSKYCDEDQTLRFRCSRNLIYWLWFEHA